MDSPTERRSGTKLALILLLAFVVRLRHLDAPFELDEFGPLYAIAERAQTPPGFLPTQDEPLAPVPSFALVRQRSILPYGIIPPLPIYHDLLYALIHLLPIEPWSLRLPSLLAGLVCVWGVYRLVRRERTEGIALAAALLVALDPIQIAMSVLARPYALANAAVVGSFLCLPCLLDAKQPLRWCIGYVLCITGMGYLNPLYLLVLSAHAASAAWMKGRQSLPWKRILVWLASLALAAILLLPQLEYVRAVGSFSREHAEYLNLVLLGSAPFALVILHNAGVLACLIVVSLGNLFAGGRRQAPEDAVVLWTARFWYFVPQALAAGLMYVGRQAVFLSRYLGYTTLGAAILLAEAAARSGSRRTFGALVGLMAGFLLVWGEHPSSKGFNIRSWDEAKLAVLQFDVMEERGLWRRGDVILFRPAFVEADFLPNQLPAATRKDVEGVVVSPINSLYAVRSRKPFVCLSLSQKRGDAFTLWAGHLYDPTVLYDESLANRLRRYRRFWLCSYAWERHVFQACFLPWLADELGWDLSVRHYRPGEPYFEVLAGSQVDEFLPGLSDAAPADFAMITLIQRKRPKGIFTLGALSAAAMPQQHITVPIWLASMARTPRLTDTPPNAPPPEMDGAKTP